MYSDKSSFRSRSHIQLSLEEDGPKREKAALSPTLEERTVKLNLHGEDEQPETIKPRCLANTAGWQRYAHPLGHKRDSRVLSSSSDYESGPDSAALLPSDSSRGTPSLFPARACSGWKIEDGPLIMNDPQHRQWKTSAEPSVESVAAEPVSRDSVHGASCEKMNDPFDSDFDLEESSYAMDISDTPGSLRSGPLGAPLIQDTFAGAPWSDDNTGCRMEVSSSPKLQDISNVIIGNSLCCWISARGLMEGGDALDSSATSMSMLPRHNSADASSSPALARPIHIRKRVRMGHMEQNVETIEESPHNSSFNPGKYMQAVSGSQPFPAVESTPVKNWSKENLVLTKTPYKSPFSSGQTPSPFLQHPQSVRRHTVTDFSSPCLNNALLSSATECTGNLIGDMSRPYALPIVPGVSNADRKYISSQTLNDLMSGNYPTVRHFHIIDCRYPYEYDGGHVKGAINQWNPADADKFLLGGCKELLSKDGEAPVLIFHCEFSLHRGPEMYRYIRGLDRERAIERYPQLSYPEMYLLHGGYKDFHTKYSEKCEPKSYVEMSDPAYARQFAKYGQGGSLKGRKSGPTKLPRRLTLRF